MTIIFRQYTKKIRQTVQTHIDNIRMERTCLYISSTWGRVVFWGREKDDIMGVFKVMCKTILLKNNDNMIISYI